MGANVDLLAEEQAFYDQNSNKLLMQYPNRHLLMHGAQLIGDFESLDEAVKEGVRRFGRGPFLVRQAGAKQARFAVPALSLGVL